MIGYRCTASRMLFLQWYGLLALLMLDRAGCTRSAVLSNEQPNQLLTMHGIMLLPLCHADCVWLANLVLPLQIDAPDVASPRLNAFSFWLCPYLAPPSGQPASSLGRGPRDCGTAYTPLTDAISLPGRRGRPVDHGSGHILGAVNMITNRGVHARTRDDDVPILIHLEHHKTSILGY